MSGIMGQALPFNDSSSLKNVLYLRPVAYEKIIFGRPVIDSNYQVVHKTRNVNNGCNNFGEGH